MPIALNIRSGSVSPASALNPCIPNDINSPKNITMPNTMTIASSIRPSTMSGPKRPPLKPSNKWPTDSGSPRASAWQPSITPPMNTGVNTRCARLPTTGMIASPIEINT